MTEKQLTEFLNEESEKINEDMVRERYFSDSDICGWKDFSENPINLHKSLEEPAKFRIRTVTTFSRSSSGNISTSNITTASGSNSPCADKSIQLKGKNPEIKANRNIPCYHNMLQTTDVLPDFQIKETPINIIRIHNSHKPRRQTKPIKVFRLPRVEKGEDE